MNITNRWFGKLVVVLMISVLPCSAFYPIYGDSVIREAKSLKKGSSVRVVMLDGSVVLGKWGGYVGYDATAFVRLSGDWLATGYDMTHIVSIRLAATTEGKI